MTEPVPNAKRTYDPPRLGVPYIPTADDMPESLQELQTGQDQELAAMSTVLDTLAPLPLGAQRRILTYLFDRYLTDPAVPQ